MNDLDNKFNKILLILITIIGIFFLITVGVLYFHAGDMITGNVSTTPERVDQNQNQVQEPETSEESPEEDFEVYELRIDATEYQVDRFEELINAHDQFEELGTDDALKAYASAIARNFVADFFTLSNKESRTDVGGVQFFSYDVAGDFTTAAIDEFYLYLGRHIEAFGNEAMPTIESTTIIDVRFGSRLVEVEEDEEDEEIDIWAIVEPEEPEYEQTIIVDIEWTFAPTTLPQIDQFQTSARFVLMEVEGEGVRIFQIEMIEEVCEVDIWGQCITEPNDPTYPTYPPITQ